MTAYWKFTAEFVDDRSFKIGQNLEKLWASLQLHHFDSQWLLVARFLRHSLYIRKK